MRHRFFLALCLLTACQAQQPPQPAPSAAATTAPFTFGSGAPPSGLPFVPYTPATFQTSLTPSEPLLGETVTVEGRTFTGAHHVVAVLRTETIVDSLPSVDVGDAPVDADGNFRLAFTLNATMGQLLLRPGDHFTLTFHEQGSDAPLNGSIGGTVATAASAKPVASAPPAIAVQLDPEAPCGQQPLHLTATGFAGSSALLRIHRGSTRFGVGPNLDQTLPVTNGRLDATVDLTPILGTGNVFYQLTVADTSNGQQAVMPLEVCNAALVEALHAPSLVLPIGSQYAGSHPDAPAGDYTLVVRSQADLDAFAARYGISARLPRLDYASQVGLLAVGVDPAITEVDIHAVEAKDGGYLVHVIDWTTDFPNQTNLAFDLQPVPRVDGPITFVTAHGTEHDRQGLPLPRPQMRI